MGRERFASSVAGCLRGCTMFAILLGGFSIQCSADSITVVGSSRTLSAAATFEQINTTDLRVTLANTSNGDVLIPSDVLTAVFFTLAGRPKLTPVSAVISADSTVLFGGTDPGGVVGGEWAYRNNLKHTPLGARDGISSSGLNLFGPFDVFPGSNLDAEASPGGLDYGLTSAGDDPTTGNKPVTGSFPLIKNGVVFILTGLPANYVLDASSISRLSFQYGTAMQSQPNLAGQVIPDAPTWALVIGGLLSLVAFRRR